MSNLIDCSQNIHLEFEYQSFLNQLQTTEMLLNHLSHLKLQKMKPKHAQFVNRMIREQHEKQESQILYLQQLETEIKNLKKK